MDISNIPRPERERRFWEVLEARQRNGQIVTQADANALAEEWQIDPPNLAEASAQRLANTKAQIHACVDINRRLAAGAPGDWRNRRVL